NTIEELERTARTLDRVVTVYGIWTSNMNSKEFSSIQSEMAPLIAAHSDKINQNAELFQRIKTVYNSPEKKKLTPEQQRLSWLYYTNFVRAGARLSPDGKKRLGEINQELASLYTKFSQN